MAQHNTIEPYVLQHKHIIIYKLLAEQKTTSKNSCPFKFLGYINFKVRSSSLDCLVQQLIENNNIVDQQPIINNKKLEFMTRSQHLVLCGIS